MNVYAVFLIQPNSEVAKRIEHNLPGSYKYSSTMFFVRDTGIAENIAVKAGIKGDERIEDASGCVIKMERFSYAGYTVRALWDWLKQTDESA